MKVSSVLCIVHLLLSFGISSVFAETLSVPDLIGNWTGTSTGHHADIGYIGSGTFEYTFIVTDQKDRIFNGTLVEEGINGHNEYQYSGIIGPDMKKLYLAEHGTGLDVGYLLSDNEMELILLVPEERSIAELCTLKRTG